MRRFVLVVAGGKGLRMGRELPKQFIPLRGKPVLMHTLEAFYRWDAAAALVVVLPAEHRSYWEMLCREIGCRVPHVLVDGGETRFHSVRNGLDFLVQSVFDRPVGEETGLSVTGQCAAQGDEIRANLPEMRVVPEGVLIGVHDGVRPFVSPRLAEACFEEAARWGAAVPAVPMVDSIREIVGNGSRPVDRARYVAVQTPQVFRGDLLLQAYAQSYASYFTDDASVVEAAGGTIRMVEGDRENIKLTTPWDLTVAEAWLAKREEPPCTCSYLM